MTRLTCHSPVSRGFTLTEILIVIGIIVLMIALAVPALGLLTGSRSIDRAENNISAMLGRARADAIGIQRAVGVLFFIDPATNNVTLAEVGNVVDGDIEPIVLDLLPDRDFMPLPKGVMSQTIDNCVFNPAGSTNRADDAYIGFNTAAVGALAPFGGVILFDGNGQLISRSYVFRARTAAAGTTQLYNVLMSGNVSGKLPDGATVGNAPADTVTPASGLWYSCFGLALIDGEAFTNNGGLDDPQAAGAPYTVAERGEETWIDENSVPLLINRYNGTLVRGE
jgi:prepilin-type N-terminal cleavage/methylation domain-containing protein